MNMMITDSCFKGKMLICIFCILYSGFIESYVSEHSARMNAMDNATNNAEKIIKKLTLTYNRVRQAAITQEISEIIGGASNV